MACCCQLELRDAQAKETTHTILPPTTSKRSKALQACLELDADSLAWLLKALYQKRPQCLRQYAQSFSLEGLQSNSIKDFQGVLKSPKVPVESKSAFSCFSVESCKAKQVAVAGEPKLEEIKATASFDGADDAKSDIDIMGFDFFSSQTTQLQDIRELDFTTPMLVHERDIANHGKSSVYVPKVQFDCPIYYAAEDGEGVEANVIRIGHLENRSVVRYETSDRSAKAGVKYHATSGAIIFEKGESLKKISLAIIDDDAWDATLEFAIDLLDDGLENAELARFQRSCRVKIIDDDTFPSNRYRSQILSGQMQKLNHTLLLFDYFKMCMTNRHVRLGTIKALLLSQLTNIYFVMNLFLDFFLVDIVLCKDCDRDQAGILLTLIVLLKLVPRPLFHYLSYRRCFWKVRGESVKILQTNLLRKFLNYDDASRNSIDEARLIVAVIVDTQEIVEFGILKIVPLTRAVTKMILVSIYQVLVPNVILGNGLAPFSTYLTRFVPMVCFPLLMIPFLLFRNKKTTRCLDAQKLAQTRMLRHFRDTVENFPLIRDYHKRGMYIDKFDARVKEVNTVIVSLNAALANNRWFAKWLTWGFSCFYLYYGGLKVSADDESLSLGEFLNNYHIYITVGQMWTQIYTILLEMLQTLDSLFTLVEMMNLQTDCHHRMRTLNKNKGLCAARLAEIRAHPSAKKLGKDPYDLLSVELRNLSFSIEVGGWVGLHVMPSTARFAQGGLFVIVGPPDEGKGTILRLLGEVFLPKLSGQDHSQVRGEGDLIVPNHLRILHVGSAPMFVEGTLHENLTFGCVAGTGDDDRKRVLAVCKLLNMSPQIIAMIEKPMVLHWQTVLSSTEAALLHIARSLIANPEMLFIHKPALYLNSEMGDNLYQVLKMYVRDRGIFQDKSRYWIRRPRTCILTARRVSGSGASFADETYYMSRTTGIVKMETSLTPPESSMFFGSVSDGDQSRNFTASRQLENLERVAAKMRSLDLNMASSGSR